MDRHATHQGPATDAPGSHVRDDHVDDDIRIVSTHRDELVEEDRASVREPFGVAQAVAVAAGIFFVVTGAIGLSRGGLADLTSPVVGVGDMTMTPLLSLIHLVLGAITLAGAAGRGAARSTLMLLGPALIAGGIVAMIEGSATLGYNDTNGAFYLASGVIAIIGAVMTPVAIVSERVSGVHTHQAR